MTWIAEDNFDSYSDGDLNGENGGSNWSGAWSGDGEFDVQDGLIIEGTKTVKVTHDSGNNFNMVRSFTALTVGLVYVTVRRSTNSNGNFYVILREGGTSRVFIRIGADGNISIFDNGIGDYQVIQAYSANTNYRIGIEFNNPSQANKARANVDNGTFTSWYTVNGGSYTNLDTIRFNATDSSSAVDAYFDYISPDFVSSVSIDESDNISIEDSVTAVVESGIWTNQDKNSASYSDQNKNSTNFSNQNKNSTNYTNQDKS